jgi:hypothetical protein
MNYTDIQLKLALSKVSKQNVFWAVENWTDGFDDPMEDFYIPPYSFWTVEPDGCNTREIVDNDLLYICWKAEEYLTPTQREKYEDNFEELFLGEEDSFDFNMLHATWQQKVIALAKTKNIEIK